MNSEQTIIIQDAIEKILIIDDEPNPEQITIIQDIIQKILITEKGLAQAKARKHSKIDAYIMEVITRQVPRSQKARQQKRRLKAFFKEKWEIEDPLAVLLINFMESWLEEGKLSLDGEPRFEKNDDGRVTLP